MSNQLAEMEANAVKVTLLYQETSKLCQSLGTSFDAKLKREEKKLKKKMKKI